MSFMLPRFRDRDEEQKVKCAYSQGVYDGIIYCLVFGIICTLISIITLWVISHG